MTYGTTRSFSGLGMRGQRVEFGCDAVDELSAAYALGALESDADDTLTAHLASCAQTHDITRELIASAALVPAALMPELPSAVLRARLLSTIASIPRAQRADVDGSRWQAPMPSREARRSWMRLGPVSAAPAAVAAVALAAAIGVGAWTAGLSGQVAADDVALRAVAAADALHPVSGSSGMGWLIEREGQVSFLVADLASLPDGQVYALWLQDPAGAPRPLGIMTDAADFALVPLEGAVAGASSFVVTIEHGLVASPTSDPVMVAALDT